MANEFTNWDRPTTSKPQAKQPLDVKWRASHAGAVRERRKAGDNPYAAEADRDRVIFRWALMFLVFVGLATALILFLGSTGK